jgi:chromosome partitioning protein
VSDKKACGKIFAIVNQKGGVGKSTTAVNLGASLALAGRKVLVVDLDPQGNTTSGLGLDKRAREQCVYKVLIGDLPMADVVERTAIEHLFAAPATIELAGAEIELVAALSRESKLKQALAPIHSEYDYVIIDCPPSLGLLTVNALTAADEIIIPIQCEYYALEGLSKLLDSVRLVKTHLNPDLEIAGVLMTMHDGRTKLSRQVIDEVRRFFGSKTYATIIPRSVRLSEAPSFGQPISVYDSRSKGARAYEELAKEVITRD